MNDLTSRRILIAMNAKEKPGQWVNNLFRGNKIPHTCIVRVSISHIHFYCWGNLKSRIEANFPNVTQCSNVLLIFINLVFTRALCTILFLVGEGVVRGIGYTEKMKGQAWDCTTRYGRRLDFNLGSLAPEPVPLAALPYLSLYKALSLPPKHWSLLSSQEQNNKCVFSLRYLRYLQKSCPFCVVQICQHRFLHTSSYILDSRLFGTSQWLYIRNVNYSVETVCLESKSAFHIWLPSAK